MRATQYLSKFPDCWTFLAHVDADENDKRKQRIELTDYCRAFCAKNDEMTMNIMKKMFDGVSEEQLQTTIQTIIQIGDNLQEIQEHE